MLCTLCMNKEKVCHLSSALSCFLQLCFAENCHAFFLQSLERQMKERERKRERASLRLVSSHHHHSLHLSPPSLILDPCPPSFRLPEWQLAASGVQWACQPPHCTCLPTGLRNTHIRIRLTHACCSSLSQRVLFLCSSGTCSSHYCPRSFVAINTCNGMPVNPGGLNRREGHTIKSTADSSGTHNNHKKREKKTVTCSMIVNFDSLS